MSEIAFTYRKCTEADAGPVVDLLVRVFGEGDADGARRTAAWWRWKYLQNPAGHQSLVATDADGAIVGFYGGVTLPVRAGGEDWQFGQACDTCTDPRLRRGLRNPGLFVRLAQAYLSTSAQPGRDAVGYGLPMPEAYRIGARFLDYWMLRSQPILVCTNAGRLPAADPAAAAEEVAGFPEDGDALFQSLESVHACLGRRDATYLNWRFRDHPERPYRIAFARAMRDGRPLGHAVYRRGLLAGRRAGIVMDWLVDPGNAAAAAALVRWAGARALEDGLAALVFVCPTRSVWFERFQGWGFRVEPSAYVMVARPVHPTFQPAFLREGWYYTLMDFDVL